MLDVAQKRLFDIILKLDLKQSLYVYGGVGTGKTMMMRRFYDSCNDNKRFMHFHEYMHHFHMEMHRLRQVKQEKGELVASIVAKQPKVLCFDEFQVTDISDAMILYNILSHTWQQGKFIFFTSNRHPSELYQNGIQRQSFLPCIDLIMKRCIVHCLDNQVDYRQKQPLHNGYLINKPDKFDDIVYKALSGGQWEIKKHHILGRQLSIPSHQGMAIFTFEELCNANLGAPDYMYIANEFHTVFLRDIPVLSPKTKAQARRFITLIDALYSKQVSCVFLAAAPPHSLFLKGPLNPQPLDESFVDSTPLFTGEEEQFAFDRAASRLVEMSHLDYMRPQLVKCFQ